MRFYPLELDYRDSLYKEHKSRECSREDVMIKEVIGKTRPSQGRRLNMDATFDRPGNAAGSSTLGGILLPMVTEHFCLLTFTEILAQARQEAVGLT